MNTFASGVGLLLSDAQLFGSPRTPRPLFVVKRTIYCLASLQAIANFTMPHMPSSSRRLLPDSAELTACDVKSDIDYLNHSRSRNFVRDSF